jgi:nitrate/nitrite-specific signal transduction histidine kinase
VGAFERRASGHHWPRGRGLLREAERPGGHQKERPRGVVIEVERTHEALALRVIDDGSGIPHEALAGKQGLGLRTMRYRARILDAAFEIRRRDEGGTPVECRVRPNRALPAGEPT